MRRLREKFRAILGTSALGGLLGGVFGTAMLGLAATAGGVTVSVFVLGVSLAAGIGAAMGAGTGALLAMSRSGSIAELSIGRSALLGAAVGAVIPLLIAVFTGGWLVPIIPAKIAVLSGLFGPAGALVAGGLVGVAKDADRRSLPSGLHPALLGETASEGDGR